MTRPRPQHPSTVDAHVRAQAAGFHRLIDYVIELEDVLQALVNARERDDYGFAIDRARTIVSSWPK